MSMSIEQLLLTKLAEECDEVSQRALKTQQFGMDERQSDMHQTNRERLHGELNDLFAVIDILNEDHGLNFETDEVAIEEKKAKLKKFMAYSQSLGKVAAS